jgi:hypothetical protein
VSDALGRVIARLLASSTSLNTLNLPPSVPVHFQRSPDFPGGPARGISGLTFQVSSGGAVIQSGTTGADGKVDVRVPPGGSATVQLLVSGAVVAEYSVTVDSGALAAVNTVLGQQQRLRMLGYQTGHSGADGNGVDGNLNSLFERSVLDFQADQGLLPDAAAGPITQPRLTSQAKA